MKRQYLYYYLFLGLVGGLVVLAVLYVYLVRPIQYAQPKTPGMTETTGITNPGTLTPTGEGTPSPTDLQQGTETAGAEAMETYWAFYGPRKINPPPTCCPPTNTPAPFRTGIYEVSFAPYCDPHACHISDVWAEVVNGEQTLVYIGGFGDTSAATPGVIKGMVFIITNSKNLSNESQVKYDVPGAIGTLRIISVDGYRLTLVDERGGMFYFDVLTRQFVDSLSANMTAPTITPLPSITPTVSPTLYIWLTEYPAPPATYPPQIYPMPVPSIPTP